MGYFAAKSSSFKVSRNFEFRTASTMLEKTVAQVELRILLNSSRVFVVHSQEQINMKLLVVHLFCLFNNVNCVWKVRSLRVINCQLGSLQILLEIRLIREGVKKNINCLGTPHLSKKLIFPTKYNQK